MRNAQPAFFVFLVVIALATVACSGGAEQTETESTETIEAADETATDETAEATATSEAEAATTPAQPPCTMISEGEVSEAIGEKVTFLDTGTICMAKGPRFFVNFQVLDSGYMEGMAATHETVPNLGEEAYWQATPGMENMIGVLNVRKGGRLITAQTGYSKNNAPNANIEEVKSKAIAFTKAFLPKM